MLDGIMRRWATRRALEQLDLERRRANGWKKLAYNWHQLADEYRAHCRKHHKGTV